MSMCDQLGDRSQRLAHTAAGAPWSVLLEQPSNVNRSPTDIWLVAFVWNQSRNMAPSDDEHQTLDLPLPPLDFLQVHEVVNNELVNKLRQAELKLRQVLFGFNS